MSLAYKQFLRSILLLAVLFSGAANAQQPILEGLDLLETNRADSFEDLSDLDLLCPGCFVIGDPVIPMQGVPLGQSPECPGNDLGLTDTIIRRLNDTPPLLPDDPPALVDIQIVELHLQSVEPFQVNCQGEDQLWMLDVTIEEPQPPGQLFIFKVQPNGGFFDSVLPVRPHLTFTRVDDVPEVICEVDPPNFIYQVQGAPWVHQAPGAPILEIPGCSSNFIPGVQEDNPPAIVGFHAIHPASHLFYFPASNLPSTIVEELPGENGRRLLLQSFPNPFSELTSVRYALPNAANVRLTVYNVLGQAVRTLVDGPVGSGPHTIDWDGRDDLGRRLGAGVYPYRVVATGVTTTGRLILLR